MKLQREKYTGCSSSQIDDASEMTRQLLHLAENMHTECLIEVKRGKWIRTRTEMGDKPAMQIRRYKQSIPELRMHFRFGNDRNKEAALFTSAGLRIEDWSKKPKEGSHRYLGTVENMLESAARALRIAVQD